jgi:hypothetical protein
MGKQDIFPKRKYVIRTRPSWAPRPNVTSQARTGTTLRLSSIVALHKVRLKHLGVILVLIVHKEYGDLRLGDAVTP